jgi:hypothetical protein
VVNEEDLCEWYSLHPFLHWPIASVAADPECSTLLGVQVKSKLKVCAGCAKEEETSRCVVVLLQVVSRLFKHHGRWIPVSIVEVLAAEAW